MSGRCLESGVPCEMFSDWHALQINFLKSFDDAGSAPVIFGIVWSIHHHSIHVGWQTMLVNDAWLLTFRNACYLIMCG